MCDEIVYSPDQELPQHSKKDILDTSKRYGFRLLHNEDITNKVIKTRSFALNQFINNKDTIINTFLSFRKDVQQEIISLIEGWKAYDRLFENRKVGYEIFLFQKEETKNNLKLTTNFKYFIDKLSVFGKKRFMWKLMKWQTVRFG